MQSTMSIYLNPVPGLVFYQGISLVASSFVCIFKPAFGHFAGLAIPNHNLSGETIDDEVAYFETLGIVVGGIVVITSLRFFGF
jgi:hypothetical protein